MGINGMRFNDDVLELKILKRFYESLKHIERLIKMYQAKGILELSQARENIKKKPLMDVSCFE